MFAVTLYVQMGILAGTIVGFKRGIQKSVKAQEAVQAAAARAAAAPVKPGRGAFIIGVKAFTYGTALCLVGSSVITFGVCTALGVSNVRIPSFNVIPCLKGPIIDSALSSMHLLFPARLKRVYMSQLQEFSDKMREILPGKRLWLEGLLKPPVRSRSSCCCKGFRQQSHAYCAFSRNSVTASKRNRVIPTSSDCY